jgi:hypothetical protein
MSDITINNLLSLLQNPSLAQQQDVGTTDDANDGADASAATSTGQDVPVQTADSSGGSATTGASTPIVSADMTALLLQLQESQEMNDAQALLYGNGSDTGTGGDLVDYLGSDGSNSGTSSDDLAQLFEDVGMTNLMSTNQSLLDYLNGVETTDTEGTGSSTTPDTASATGIEQ